MFVGTDQSMEKALMCPQCNAPLAPHRFAQSVVCSYCGTTIRFDVSSISAARFHEAFRVWNSPDSYQLSSWVSIKDKHWALGKRIAQGSISDVYTGQRARWPTELAILKILRDREDGDEFDNEWNVLQTLHRSNAPGVDNFTLLIPQPIIHGHIAAGSFAGKRVSVFRWAGGFYHNFYEVIQAYPQGIPHRASIWIWRRILEVLSFIHASGMVHGAVFPSHLLIQENEHGVRLVGYGCSGRIGEKLRSVSQNFESFYPQSARSRLTLTAQLDLAMSARCIIALLGGDPTTASLDTSVPVPLIRILQRVARIEQTGKSSEDAWSIREEIGDIAKQVYGAPQFIPIVMPS